jgi:UDP-N-acetylglucosamine diphosphorylase / glucose-1-phosphate thymidylyltransferase / UDP-N-acetylgalactosamine diphosphorylase / glucosamine-1-phosphate N-acetyltransferase / galactosamine-1-phosphate N-acetyltransferase
LGEWIGLLDIKELRFLRIALHHGKGSQTSKMKASDYFDLPESLEDFRNDFDPQVAPWEWLNQIAPALQRFFEDKPGVSGHGEIPSGLFIKGDVYIHPSVKLPPYGVIEGPAYIGPECELRPGVYIRGNVIAGKHCVMGNSCEYKNSLLMDSVESAHFNYVGDSILGTKAHLGAGVILANIRLDRKDIKITTDTGMVDTGRRKIGAIIGEGVEISCNSVIQPGSLIGKRAYIVCSPSAGGVIKERSIVRLSL